MAYTPAEVVKAQKIADLTVGLVEAQLTIPKLFTHETFDKFKGAEGDKMTFRVPGRLPYRKFAWRNNRANPIFFDTFKEGKTDITIGDSIYSATKLTDEQFEFDLGSWAKVAQLQADAVAQGVQDEAVKALEDAPYSVTIGLGGTGDGLVLKAAFFEARRVMNLLRVPKEARFAVVGSDVEAGLLDLVSTVQSRADGALGSAQIGKIAGFDVFADISIDPGEAYFFVPSAFVMFNAAAYVPQSVPFGTTASADFVKLRWLRDYDTENKADRSLVDTYVTVAPVKDLFFGKSTYTSSADPVKLEPDTTPHFVRGVKLTIAGPSVYPAVGSALALETGLSQATARFGV